jgi:hypothetical protein
MFYNDNDLKNRQAWSNLVKPNQTSLPRSSQAIRVMPKPNQSRLIKVNQGSSLCAKILRSDKFRGRGLRFSSLELAAGAAIVTVCHARAVPFDFF